MKKKKTKQRAEGFGQSTEIHQKHSKMINAKCLTIQFLNTQLQKKPNQLK